MSSATDSRVALNLGDLGIEGFLQQYWQQRPLVIRQGFTNFEDPVCADELAGLASEDFVESRLIYRREEKWQALHGPFDDYSDYGEDDWTLVVQSANHWDPAAADLIEAFDFLPRWRLDDVMISFAATGGSVGPHIDQYDTFIIQGSGRRHWRVGPQANYKNLIPHPALKHIEGFTANIDVVLNPGDILYIPPGFPHEGIALEPSMSFSVGYRAPTDTELVSGLADYLADKNHTTFMQDPQRPQSQHCGAITGQDVLHIKSLLTQLLNDDDVLADFTASYLSQENRQLDDLTPAIPLDTATMAELLQQGQLLYRLGGLRCFYLEECDHCSVYIQGQRHDLPITCKTAIEQLCDQTVIGLNELAQAMQFAEFKHFLLEQLNMGHWYFDNSQ